MNNTLVKQIVEMLEEKFPQICNIRFVDGYDKGIPEIYPDAYRPRGNKHSFVVEWKIKATGARRGYAVSPRLIEKEEKSMFLFPVQRYTEYDYSLDHVIPQIIKAIEHSLTSDKDVQLFPRFTYESRL